MTTPEPAPFTVAYVVGVTPGKWSRVWAERMRDQPLAQVQLSPAEALTALAERRADVALVRLPVADDSLACIPLYEEKPVVVVPKDHAIEAVDAVTLADLGSENVLDGDWADAVDLVAANVGVAIMPQSVARSLSRKDVVARFVTDAPTTRIALVWLQEHTTDLVEEFVGIVRGRTANSSRGRGAEPEPAAARASAPQRTSEQRTSEQRKPGTRKPGPRKKAARSTRRTRPGR